MIIGVPKEAHRQEHRVGLSPFAVSRLVKQGHSVIVEHGAGESAHFPDGAFERAGATIVYDTDEIYQRSNMICAIEALTREELDRLRPDSIVCAFHHLAVAPRAHIERLVELRTTLIGYEIIRNGVDELPVLRPFSEMAGQLAMNLAAYYLQKEPGGRGVLMGNVPGVPPPTVLILGAGTAGHAAARQAVASGVHTIVLDADMRKLETLSRELGGHAVTVVAAHERLATYTAIADVIIGAVLVPGGRTPFLVTEPMVRAMKPGSVIVDLSIDQGGCFETSRPTSLDDPTFRVHDVVHYCVPNMTSNIPRTASRALVNAALPYLLKLADKGLEGALATDPGLAAGMYMHQGEIVNDHVRRALGLAGAEDGAGEAP